MNSNPSSKLDIKYIASTGNHDDVYSASSSHISATYLMYYLEIGPVRLKPVMHICMCHLVRLVSDPFLSFFLPQHKHVSLIIIVRP